MDKNEEIANEEEEGTLIDEDDCEGCTL
jgi:hypothetical protein